MSWSDPNKVREVVAVGSRRRVVFNDLNDVERVRYFERGVAAGDGIAETYGEFKLLVRDGDIVSPKVEPSEPLKNQCLEFVDAISTGRAPLASGVFGRGVVRALAAIEASMRARGAAVEVCGDRMRILAATFAYNEGDKIRRTLARHPPRAPTICWWPTTVRPTARSTGSTRASSSFGTRPTAASAPR